MAIGGVGSGLDVNSLVQQLVAAERAPADGRLDRASRRTTAEVSAVGTLRGAFSALKSALAAVTSRENALARTVTVPADAGFTASAGTTASVGTAQIDVRAIAVAHKLSSPAYLNTDAAVGTGTLAITAGTTSISLSLDSTNNSLGALRDAINTAAGGKGVSASIITADDGAHLVLTALDTGTSKAIRVTQSGGNGGLAPLAFSPPAASSMTQVSVAADAVVRVDGLERTSASNVIGDLISGVTLTLTKAEPGVTRELKIASDTTAQRNAVKNVLNAYNASTAAINTVTAYNSTTQVAAALNGDSMVRGLATQLRGQVSAQVTDLKAVGITINKDGTLKMDDGAFDAAIQKDPALAARLFGTGPTSFVSTFKTSVDGILVDNGPIDGRGGVLAARTKLISKQRTDLDYRMSLVEKNYRTQFTNLDTMVTKLQSSSTFLQQQLARL